MNEPARIDSLKTLGKYALIEKLSDGYLGTVYRSFDPELDRAVEIRILSDGIKWDPDIEDLFRKECNSVAHMQHPNIASIIEVSTEGRFPYMVMESLGDRNLKKLIVQNPVMSFETKISIMVQVAEGLGYAHKCGVMHRNVCPENIFMTTDGSIKIRDFAIAHILMKHLPHPGVRWGAPIYLSPEQIKHKQSNAQSDIFALGIVFYELLTGVHPFYDPDSNKALDNILQNVFLPTFEQYPEFHPRIWHILKTCLAKNPDDRYENVNELLDAYRNLLKDLADDVQMMLSELQISFTSLRIAAERPNASESLVRLFEKVRNLLHNVENVDYMQLDLLIAELIETYPEIQEAGVDQKILDSLLNPPIPPEENSFTLKAEPLSEQEEDVCVVALTENPVTSDLIQEDTPLAKIPFVEAQVMPVDEAQVEPVDEAQVEPVDEAQVEPVDEAQVEPVKDTGSKIQDEENVPGQADLKETRSNDLDALQKEGNVKEANYISDEPVSGTIQEASAYEDRKSPRRRKASRWKSYRIPKPTFRTVALFLLLLLIVAVFHTVQGKSAGETLRSAWKNFILDPFVTAKASALSPPSTEDSENIAIGAAEIKNNETSPAYENALMETLEASYPGDALSSPSKKRLDLSGQSQAKNPSAELELKRKQAQQAEAGQNKEEAWDRQFASFFSQGKYKEADHVVGLWRGELPESAGVQKSGAKIREIQTRISASTSAMEESRYHDALAELSIVERINPTDPNVSVLRTEIESRMASARGTLTVYRLGDKATLLLDGNGIDSDGEVQGKSIPIGSHTIAIKKDGYLVTSRSQELFEGQTMALVYDLAQRNIRPMIESDRVLLAQRKAMEETYSFTLEHSHGIFRGNCRGELVIGYHDIVYRPSSGAHGFRVPFRLIELKRDGRSIDLYFVSDNEHFHEFKFDDEQAALKFNQAWKSLKALPQP